MSEFERPMPPDMVAPFKTREAIRTAVDKALVERHDGPGFSWRGWLMADVLRSIANAKVLYPRQVAQLRTLADTMANEAEDNLQDEWPK